jgi:hypothetical protein
LKLLEKLPSEENSIISGWNKIGVKTPDAATSQALIQLKNEYCNKKFCLLCSVGNKIISQLK